MKMKRLNSINGFTLLEVVVAMSIMAFMLASLGYLMSSERRLFADSKAMGETSEKMTYTMYLIKREVRTASSASIQITGSYKMLTLNAASGSEKAKFKYNSGEDEMQIKTGGSGSSESYVTIADFVDDANFYLIDSKTISITMTGKDEKGKSISLTSSVMLRN